MSQAFEYFGHATVPPSDDNRQAAQDLFLAALDLPPAERSAFLERRAGDDAVRREAAQLLALDAEGMGKFLAKAPIPAVEPIDEPGQQIGPFTLLAKLGEGGFGDVFLAEQSQPFRRRVALKLLKLGLQSREITARFEAERQTLALLEHPHVAKVFDAGNTPEGRPYFVMEHVDGVSITRHADERRLGTVDRLHLFTQVCDAIQHAHHKGVIHRDIKPSNVLVEKVGGKGHVKVIDFGIAKAIAPELAAGTLLTREGQLVGTPEYMSPEQAEMSGRGVDARTDIYSLGVLLYELLVGVTPFDPEALRRAGLSGLLRTIREEDPPRPSTRLLRLAERGSELAARRGEDADGLRRALKGDLDWIVMKAMEKAPERRYASAAELAADLGRHLRHEPVLASPPRAAYRVRKFLRRNRLLAASSAAVVLALALGIAATAAAWLRAREKQARAERRFTDVRQLASTFLFDFHDRIRSLAGATAAREHVVVTGLKYLTKLAKEATGDAALQLELAAAFLSARFHNSCGFGR